jgi:hypothetical protein
MGDESDLSGLTIHFDEIAGLEGRGNIRKRHDAGEIEFPRDNG